VLWGKETPPKGLPETRMNPAREDPTRGEEKIFVIPHPKRKKSSPRRILAFNSLGSDGRWNRGRNLTTIKNILKRTEVVSFFT